MGVTTAIVSGLGALAGIDQASKAQSAQEDANNKALAQGQLSLEEQKAADAAQLEAANKAAQQQHDADAAALQASKDAAAQQKAEFDIAQTNAQKQFESQQTLAQQQFDKQLKSTSEANAAAMAQAKSAAAAQQSALSAQVDAANRLYQSQSEQMNAANQKTPDTASITAANVQSGKSGQSGTMLTGQAGVDLSQLLLSKNTLLGS